MSNQITIDELYASDDCPDVVDPYKLETLAEDDISAVSTAKILAAMPKASNEELFQIKEQQEIALSRIIKRVQMKTAFKMELFEGENNGLAAAYASAGMPRTEARTYATHQIKQMFEYISHQLGADDINNAVNLGIAFDAPKERHPTRKPYTQQNPPKAGPKPKGNTPSKDSKDDPPLPPTFFG